MMQPKTLGSLLRMAPGLSSNGTCAAARPKKDGSKRYRTAVRISVIPVRGKPYTLEAAGRMFPIRQSTVCLRIGYEIIERTIDKHGQYLFPADIEVNTWWTNLGQSDDDVIRLYHEHGESEQYHSEIKTDMDVERFPSGKFDTNELVLELTVLAYNILRVIGQKSLKSSSAPKTEGSVQ